jgi:hypothetical protein
LDGYRETIRASERQRDRDPSKPSLLVRRKPRCEIWADQLSVVTTLLALAGLAGVSWVEP